jgi:hypothetical protein
LRVIRSGLDLLDVKLGAKSSDSFRDKVLSVVREQAFWNSVSRDQIDDTLHDCLRGGCRKGPGFGPTREVLHSHKNKAISISSNWKRTYYVHSPQLTNVVNQDGLKIARRGIGGVLTS